MTNVHEFGALNWVKGELDESVRKARQALEAYAESEDDNEALAHCAEHLHQIAGVLQMVQIYGPGMLAEEMEAVARAMAEGHVRQMQDAAEVLMLALIQLPDYLEKLQSGDVDIPIIILPLLNDLRAVREAPLLSEAALFRPTIQDARVSEHLTGEPNQQIPALVHRLRQKFHLGLLGWFRQQQVEKGWHHLLEVFDELEKNAGTPQFYHLVWVSGALVRGLIDHSITPGIAIKQLFSKVDRKLKRVIDEGEAVLGSGQTDDLLKNLLYYIAQAESDDPRIRKVKDTYDLDSVLLSEAELIQGRQGLSGSNAELAASISEAIQDELTRVKDVLDLFMRKQDAELGMLEHLEKPLRQLADTLGMIGQGSLRSRLLRQANRVQVFLEKDTPPEEYELMEMAGDILYVESSLSTMESIESSEAIDAADDDGKWGVDLPKGEYEGLIKQTVREAKIDIAKAKEVIIGYTESPSEPEILENVYQGLLRVYGALKILELSDSAHVLQKTAEFIKTYLIDSRQVPDHQQLNLLADVISSIEYFLEALVDGAGDRREIIAIAQSALSKLLHSLPDFYSNRDVDEAATLKELALSEGEQIAVYQSDSEAANETENVIVKEEGEKSQAILEIPIRSSEKPPLEEIDAEILEIFLEEAREELESIQQDLPAWQKNKEDKNALISFRRSFHTLKGSGRLVGAKLIGDLAWSIESMLNGVIDETIQPSSEMMELLNHTLEILPDLIDCQERNVLPDVDVDSFMQKAFALADGRILREKVLPGGQKPSEQEAKLESEQVDEASGLDQSSSTQPSSDSIETDASSFEQHIPEPSLDPSDFLIESDLHDDTENIQQQGFSDSDLMIEVDTELLDVFAEESESHLADLANFISLARSSDPRPLVSEEIIRAFHTLDGSARMTGITPIANLSKSVEEYLKIQEANHKVADDDVLTLLEGSINSVRKLLTWLMAEDLPEPDVDSYLVRLTKAKNDLLSQEKTECLTPSCAMSPSQDASESGVDKSIEIEGSEGLLNETDVLSIDSSSFLQEDKLFAVDEDPELVEIFQEEANELLKGISSSYKEWLSDQDSAAQLETIQRSLHTLKGSARLAGILPVGDLANVLEKVFSTAGEMEIQTSGPLVNAINHALDTLSVQVQEIDAHGKIQWADTSIDDLEVCLEDLRILSSEDTAVNNKLRISEEEINEAPALSEGQNELSETAVAQEDVTDDQEDNRSNLFAEPLSLISDDDLFVLDDDPELLAVFIDESKELLLVLEDGYKGLNCEVDNTQQISEIQRTLHTLKGSARLSGVLPVGDISHALEAIFNDFVIRQGAISGPAMQLIRQSLDVLATQIEEAESLGLMHREDALMEKLASFLQTSEHDASELTTTLKEDGELSELNYVHDESSEEENSELLFEPLSYLQDDGLFDIGEDSELIAVFCEEAKEIMEQLETGYQSWTASHGNSSLIGDMQRSLHTLKGSARLAGIIPVGDLSHAVESLLTWSVNESIEISDSLLNLMRQAMDMLASQVDDISSLGKVTLADDLVQHIDTFMQPGVEKEAGEVEIEIKKKAKDSNKKKVQAEEPADSAIVLPFISEIAKRIEPRKETTKTKPFRASKDQVRISADIMDSLVNNAGEVSIYRARLEQQNNVLGFNLSELEQTVSRLHTQLRNLEIETEKQILYRWERENEKNDRDKAEFDPLELDRFSNMQQLSRALAETVSDLGSINQSLTDLQRETDTLLLQQSRISTDLQDGLLRTRMVPFAQQIPRMQRLVRQTADQVGKKAQLKCFGIEGEIDRNILNRIIPVLEHLLRNAVSHGIESPADRLAADKNEMGLISLYIDREATNVLITLSDDGRGLDLGEIRSQALKQGMIKQSTAVSDDDLIQYVLNPGFSTAKEVTQIAGRGVGLDVVASEVKQLGGGLEIDSQAGRGTSFTIRLPLTLAITDALLVKAGEEVYAIPHGSIEGVVRIKQKELQACYAGKQEYYSYANRQYKTSSLGQMVGLGKNELSESVKWFPLMLVHAGEHHAALQVDELLGTRQIVVKSIGKQAGSVRWITGGTILADGRVALILDVGALVRMDAARLPSAIPSIDVINQQPGSSVRVMVVDDSITVRKVTGRLLERNAMEVVTAKDGIEAIAMLQEQMPDVMLLDIEMPRMDGFELARHINNSVDYYGLPIIMISSRVGEKHRKRAFDLGVKRCLGKPFQEAELLDNINQVLAEVKS